MQHAESRALLAAAVGGADAKLAEDPVAIDVSEALGVVDFFVILSGRNTRQVTTVVEAVEEEVRRRTGRGPLRIEGLRDATWVLMDYGDVIVHVFLDETRRYYDLEHLWSGAPRVELGELLETRAADVASS